MVGNFTLVELLVTVGAEVEVAAHQLDHEQRHAVCHEPQPIGVRPVFCLLRI